MQHKGRYVVRNSHNCHFVSDCTASDGKSFLIADFKTSMAEVMSLTFHSTVADAAKRIFDIHLPKHAILRKATLEYILSGKLYLGSDFVKAIAVKLAITSEQLALRIPRKVRNPYLTQLISLEIVWALTL